MEADSDLVLQSTNKQKVNQIHINVVFLLGNKGTKVHSEKYLWWYNFQNELKSRAQDRAGARQH